MLWSPVAFGLGAAGYLELKAEPSWALLVGLAAGLAILASLAGYQAKSLLTSGESLPDALTSGYHLAFIVGAVFAAIAALVSLVVLRKGRFADENTEMAGAH
jgi:hypothetical protein